MAAMLNAAARGVDLFHRMEAPLTWEAAKADFFPTRSCVPQARIPTLPEL